jgi:hypothetical protein
MAVIGQSKEVAGVLIPEWLTPTDDGARISSYALGSVFSDDRDLVVVSGVIGSLYLVDSSAHSLKLLQLCRWINP